MISGEPSPLISLIATETGLFPVLKSVLAEKEGVEAPFVVVLKRTETVLLLPLATTISGLPSPLRSPIATETGLIPVLKSVLSEKEGVKMPLGVVFKKTDIVFPLLPALTATISGLPSPLISPTVTHKGVSPV